MSGRARAAVGGSLHTHHIGAHGHLSLHLKSITTGYQSYSQVYTYYSHNTTLFLFSSDLCFTWGFLCLNKMLSPKKLWH